MKTTNDSSMAWLSLWVPWCLQEVHHHLHTSGMSAPQLSKLCTMTEISNLGSWSNFFFFFYKDQHGIFQQMWALWGHRISHSQLTLGISKRASSCREWWPRCHNTGGKKKGHSACYQGSGTADTTFTESLNTGANSMTKSSFWYALAKWPWTSNLVFLRFMVLGLLKWE